MSTREILTSAEYAQVLAVIAEPQLYAVVAQCAAAARAELSDGLAAEQLIGLWRTADIVICDCAGLQEIEHLQLPCRAGLFLVCEDDPPWDVADQWGAQDVFALPARAGDVAETMAVSGRTCAGGLTIAVQGAVGGAGASTVAASVGLLRAREGCGGCDSYGSYGSYGTVLVDTDIAAGSDDLLLGLEGETGARWGDLALHNWRETGIDGSDVVARLPQTAEGLGVLATGRGESPLVPASDYPELTAAMIDALRSQGSTVIADISAGRATAPGIGEEAETRARPGDVGIVVLPATLRGLHGALHACGHFRAWGIDPIVVMGRGLYCGVSRTDVETLTAAPVVAEFPVEKRIAREIELQGLRIEGRSAFAKAMAELTEAAFAAGASGCA